MQAVGRFGSILVKLLPADCLDDIKLKKRYGGTFMAPGFGLGCLSSFGNYGWVISLLIPLVALIGFIWLFVWVIRKAFPNHDEKDDFGQNSAEILKIRYARGEITREQYQQILGDLG